MFNIVNVATVIYNSATVVLSDSNGYMSVYKLNTKVYLYFNKEYLPYFFT